MNHSERAITVAEARERVKAEPKRFRAAVLIGTPPLRDNGENTAVLFRLVRTAQEFFRAEVERLEEGGWKRVKGLGNLGAEILVFEKAGERRAVGVDKGRLRAV